MAIKPGRRLKLLPRNDAKPSPWQQLVVDAQSCMLCPRMVHSKRVLSDQNGDAPAQVVFVAEAPGRLGAQVTGIPLFGDRTGIRFEELLRAMSWSRSRVFITNAVLCNPRDDQGNNDLPRAAEINNCSSLLARTISVVNPKLVVALGRVALNALKTVCSHDLELRQAAGHVSPWGSRYLGVLYHPGPRTQVHRKWCLQIEDAKAVAAFAAQELGITSLQSEDWSLFGENRHATLVAGD